MPGDVDRASLRGHVLSLFSHNKLAVPRLVHLRVKVGWNKGHQRNLAAKLEWIHQIMKVALQPVAIPLAVLDTGQQSCNYKHPKEGDHEGRP